jgi:hypothetical protein
VNWKSVAVEEYFVSRYPKKAHLVAIVGFLVVVLCGVTCAQNCSEFKLAAQPSSRSVRPKDSLSFVVTLANKSAKSVTVVSRELPNTWAIYQQAGDDWVSLSSGGLVRGSVSRSLPEQSTPTVPDLFPSEEYKHVPPGGVLEGQYDLSEELWKAVSGLKTRPAVRIRFVLGYKYQASPDEAKFGMLQCDLQTTPIDVQVVMKERPRDRQPKSRSDR